MDLGNGSNNATIFIISFTAGPGILFMVLQLWLRSFTERLLVNFTWVWLKFPSFWLESNFEVLKTSWCLLIDFNWKFNVTATVYWATLGIYSSKEDFIRVDFKWLFTFAIVDTVESYRQETVDW